MNLLRTNGTRLVGGVTQTSCVLEAPPRSSLEVLDNAVPNEDLVSKATSESEQHSLTCCADQCGSPSDGNVGVNSLVMCVPNHDFLMFE